jgi:hypothetical protein
MFFPFLVLPVEFIGSHFSPPLTFGRIVGFEDSPPHGKSSKQAK